VEVTEPHLGMYLEILKFSLQSRMYFELTIDNKSKEATFQMNKTITRASRNASSFGNEKVDFASMSLQFSAVPSQPLKSRQQTKDTKARGEYEALI
jgi:hypothetical protein